MPDLSDLNRQDWMLLAALTGTILFVFIGTYSFFTDKLPASKLIRTASSLAAFSSVLQLKISGWFSRAIEHYDDVNKFPMGPPDEIVRRVIDDPEHPLQMAIRNALFLDVDTGAKLGFVSIVLAVWATWS